MLKLQDLKAFFEAGLQQRGVRATVTVQEQPDQDENDPDNPGQKLPNLTLIATSGLGLTLEGVFDRPSFQALCRGKPGSVAEALAYVVDSLVIDAARPFDLGGYRVVDAGRIGGNPGYLGIDEPRRTEYSASYWFEMER